VAIRSGRYDAMLRSRVCFSAWRSRICTSRNAPVRDSTTWISKTSAHAARARVSTSVVRKYPEGRNKKMASKSRSTERSSSDFISNHTTSLECVLSAAEEAQSEDARECSSWSTPLKHIDSMQPFLNAMYDTSASNARTRRRA
jgi:hypothetical protein